MTAKRLRILLAIHQCHRGIEAHERYFVLLKLVQSFAVETCGLFKSLDESLYLKRFSVGRKGGDVNLVAKP
ncbi:hypothetical protein D3C75_846000 [compost metagenome]